MAYSIIIVLEGLPRFRGPTKAFSKGSYVFSKSSFCTWELSINLISYLDNSQGISYCMFSKRFAGCIWSCRNTERVLWNSTTKCVFRKNCRSCKRKHSQTWETAHATAKDYFTPVLFRRQPPLLPVLTKSVCPWTHCILALHLFALLQNVQRSYGSTSLCENK